VIALLLALASAGPGGDPAAAFREAGERYLAGDFEEAVRRYQALVEAGWSGAALHYDLGNAWLRAGRPGKAAASWERALRLDPDDAEARANLALVRRPFAARLPWARPEPLAERAAALLSDRQAVGGLSAAWIALWALLALRLRAWDGRRALLGLGAGIAGIAAVALGAAVAVQARAAREPVAVVVAADAPLREAPSPGLPATLALPEAARVRIVAVEGAFCRVRLPGGLEGFAAAADLEPVGAP